MAAAKRASLLLTLLAACGFPRPADVGDDANPGHDSGQPGTTIQVAGTGDDSNDGITKPIKTLKHAIGLASQSHQITNIVLASGRYSTLSGETFPYTLPADVTVRGSAGGGTIFAGSNSEAGIMVDGAALQDLEFEDFTVAIAATGAARLADIRVRTKMTAVRAETAGRLVIDNLDITGAATACATGIALNGAADLVATTLVTRGLGTTLNAKDQSTVSITSLNVTGDPTCVSTVLRASNKTFTLQDGFVDGGYGGLALTPVSTSQQAVITNTVLRNLRSAALVGSPGTGGTATMMMTGGEISNSGGFGIELYHGSWSFTNVAINEDSTAGIFLLGIGPQLLSTLRMRGCTVRGNEQAIHLEDWTTADLGTVDNPGNNSFLSSTSVGLDVAGSAGPTQINAVGNTWRPSRQGADSGGKYTNPAGPITGPVTIVAGNNYAIAGTYTVQINPPQ